MRDLFEKSYDIVKDAMKDVKHEICITLEDGTPHIVFIHNIEFLNDGGVSVDWSTLSENRKKELEPHVDKCVSYMIEETIKSRKKKLFQF